MMNTKLHNPAARVLATLVVAAGLSGCAMKGDIRILQDEIRAISVRQDSLMAELRAETMQTQDTLRTQTDQIFDFRGDISRRLQQIEQTLVTIEAIVGQNQNGMEGIRDQLANLRRLPPGGGGPTQPVGGDPSGGSESLVGGGGNADELWNVAQSQLDRQSLNSATQAFEQFIAQHPADPRVPDAHFFLADILVQQERPEDAIEAFQSIQELSPTHARVPQALFRIALIQEGLGDLDEARATLERIVNTYPDDFVAGLAREKLREIG